MYEKQQKNPKAFWRATYGADTPEKANILKTIHSKKGLKPQFSSGILKVTYTADNDAQTANYEIGYYNDEGEKVILTTGALEVGETIEQEFNIGDDQQLYIDFNTGSSEGGFTATATTKARRSEDRAEDNWDSYGEEEPVKGEDY